MPKVTRGTKTGFPNIQSRKPLINRWVSKDMTVISWDAAENGVQKDPPPLPGTSVVRLAE